VTQPEYVPLKAADRVRPIERLPAADAWRADRPADFTEPGMPTGRKMCTPSSNVQTTDISIPPTAVTSLTPFSAVPSARMSWMTPDEVMHTRSPHCSMRST